MIALLNLSVFGFLFAVFHDKAKGTQQGNLLPTYPISNPVFKKTWLKLETDNSTYSTICVLGWPIGDISPGILAFERNLIIQRINETTHDPARLNISLDSPKDP